MTKILDITGEKYGLLRAMRRTDMRSGTSYKWICLCDCGGFACVASNNLRTGHTDNCGCLTFEKKSNAAGSHHMTKTKAYSSWLSIKRRCFEESFPNYNMYGGRGITMQESWRDDFVKFFEYIGEPPAKNSSVDRIDNNGDYCEGNIKWSSPKQQAKNKGKYSSNTTGTTGVNLVCKNGVWYYIAIWEEGGKQRNKVFSVNKHGLLPAMAKAVQVRQEKLKWLQQHDGYSTDHGEPRKDRK